VSRVQQAMSVHARRPAASDAWLIPWPFCTARRRTSGNGFDSAKRRSNSPRSCLGGSTTAKSR
jgi:hypothetical protein